MQSLEQLVEAQALPPNMMDSSPDSIWFTINRRLEELEQRTQRILEEERNYREQQVAERDRQLQARMDALESSVDRSLEATMHLTQGLEERESRIQAQVNRLETAQARVAERFSENLNGQSQQMTPIVKSNIKYVLPEFNGEGSPMRYLRQLRQYWDVVRPRDCDSEYLIEKSLSGPPADWWLIVKDDITSLDSYVSKFQQRYWNEHIQHEIKKKLEFGFYQPNQDRSRAEYATKLFASANELIPAPESAEVIRKLARHYSDEIKYAIIGRGITKYEQLIELLEDFDKIGGTNTGHQDNRDRTRNNAIRENTQNQTNMWRSQSHGNSNPRPSGSGNQGGWHVPAQQGNTPRQNIGNGPRQQAHSAPQRTQWEGNSWRQPHTPNSYRVQNIEIENSPENEVAIHPTEDNSQEAGNEQEPRQ